MNFASQFMQLWSLADKEAEGVKGERHVPPEIQNNLKIIVREKKFIGQDLKDKIKEQLVLYMFMKALGDPELMEHCRNNLCEIMEINDTMENLEKYYKQWCNINQSVALFTMQLDMNRPLTPLQMETVQNIFNKLKLPFVMQDLSEELFDIYTGRLRGQNFFGILQRLD